MKCFKLDENGDLVISTNSTGGKNIALVEGVEEILQAVKLQLGQWLGEDAFHPDIGLPVPSMVGARSVDFVQGVITDALRKDPRVKAINGLVIKEDEENEGVMRIEVQITTTEGTGTLATTIGGHH